MSGESQPKSGGPGVWALHGAARFFSGMPLPHALAWGRVMGGFFGNVLRYHRADAVDALAKSFPQVPAAEREKILRRMYAHFGMNIAELMRMSRLTLPEAVGSIEVEGEHNLHEAFTLKRGVIILTGHIGNWDLLCSRAPGFGYPLTVITKNLKQGSLNREWMRTRERFGVKFVPAHHSYRQCLTALRKNEQVGFILDQNMIRSEGVFVDFFGRPACTSPGLAYMAAQSKAPVVPAFSYRQPGGIGHRAVFHPMLPPPESRDPAAMLRHTQQYTRILEDAIRVRPDQWIWLHRRWKTQPLSPA